MALIDQLEARVTAAVAIPGVESGPTVLTAPDAAAQAPSSGTKLRHQVGTKLRDQAEGPSWDQTEAEETRLLAAAATPRTLAELMALFGYTDRTKFRRRYLQPLLDTGSLRMTVPDSPRSPNQRYVAVHPTAPTP